MICLVGEQPLPNLLPARYYEPEHVVLAYTQTTREVSARLERVLSRDMLVYPQEVPSYDIPATRHILEEYITGRGWKPAQVVFNLTGATKAMAFAAYSLASAWQSSFVYMEGEDAASKLYRYRFDLNGTVSLDGTPDYIPSVIELEDYFEAHLDSHWLGDFPTGEGGEFERVVYQTLKPAVDEIVHSVVIGGALEIDLAVRCGNQVGIAEVKKGKLVKKAIDQLNTAGRREFLGIYTKKLLIVGKVPEDPLVSLKELAGGAEIEVIELPSYDTTGNLSGQDRERLVREVSETLGHR